MNRSMVIGIGLLVGFFIGGFSLGSANAQEAVLAELYGQGVHAYFARDLRTAHELLTNAIAQGSHDPRCFYYRGLTYLQLGRPDEANADFKAGALAEATATDRIYPVADSLQRIQGRMRMQIEKHRQVAKMTSAAKAIQVQKARYEQLKRSEQDVVRDPSKAAAPTTAPAVTAEPLPPANNSDPFAGAETKPEKAPEKAAEAAVAPAEADPFGGAATPAAPPAAAPAADPTAPAAPATDATTDPFKDDKPAEAAPAAPAAPATPPAAVDDPFK